MKKMKKRFKKLFEYVDPVIIRRNIKISSLPYNFAIAFFPLKQEYFVKKMLIIQFCRKVKIK